MNGRYQLSETGGSNTSKYPDYRDYPGGVEYFDVYSPLISQLYSQVYWKALPPAHLPAEIVRKFAGRAMAVVGFEIDQVQNPSVSAAGGSSTPGSEDLSGSSGLALLVHTCQIWGVGCGGGVCEGGSSLTDADRSPDQRRLQPPLRVVHDRRGREV
jgi:hypothetical protein